MSYSIGCLTSYPFFYYRFNDENDGEKKMLPQYDDPAEADEVFGFSLLRLSISRNMDLYILSTLFTRIISRIGS